MLLPSWNQSNVTCALKWRAPRYRRLYMCMCVRVSGTRYKLGPVVKVILLNNSLPVAREWSLVDSPFSRFHGANAIRVADFNHWTTVPLASLYCVITIELLFCLSIVVKLSIYACSVSNREILFNSTNFTGIVKVVYSIRKAHKCGAIETVIIRNRRSTTRGEGRNNGNHGTRWKRYKRKT